MPTRVRLLFAAATLALPLVATTEGVAGSGDRLKITDSEIAELPTFCWAELGSSVAKGPAFSIPRSCGVGMNHYCEALVNLLRAKRRRDKGKAGQLGLAETQVRYTLNWMNGNAQKNPSYSCPIRGHVVATAAEIEILKKITQIPK